MKYTKDPRDQGTRWEGPTVDGLRPKTTSEGIFRDMQKPSAPLGDMVGRECRVPKTSYKKTQLLSGFCRPQKEDDL